MSQLFEKFKQEMVGQKIWSPVQSVSFFVEGSLWNDRKYYEKFYTDPKPSPILVIGKGEEGIGVPTADIIHQITEETFLKYWQNPALADKINQQYQGYSDAVDGFYEKYDYKYVNQVSEAELTKTVHEVLDPALYGQTLALCGVAFDEDKCLRILKEQGVEFSQEKFQEIWSHGMVAVSESFGVRRLRKFLEFKLLEKLSSDRLIERSQYFLVGHSVVPSLQETENYLQQEFHQYNTDEKAQARLDQLNQERQARAKNLSIYKDSVGESEKRLVDYLQLVIEKRDIRKDLLGKAMTVMHRIAQRFCREADIPGENIRNMSQSDFVQGVNYLKTNKEQILVRKNGFSALILDNSQIEFELGKFEEDKALIKELYLSQQTDENNNTKIIKGSTGAPGKVRGKVKIVLNLATDSAKLELGDILVAGMTRPDYLPLMKKAAAFVTDEGGVTCHAAVVAREMNKPAVVGTKIGSHVLKDGMEVEVDADQGVVKIL